MMYSYSSFPVLLISFFQPSIYLRLLEDPSSVNRETSLFCSSKSSLSQSGCSCSLSPSNSLTSPPHSPSPALTEHDYPECHFSATPLTPERDDQHLTEAVEQVNYTTYLAKALIPTLVFPVKSLFTTCCVCRVIPPNCPLENFQGGP